MSVNSIFIVIIVSVIIIKVIIDIISPLKRIQKRREKHIEEYEFPQSIFDSIKIKYNHLSEDDIHLTLTALKEYFLINSRAKNSQIAMPSKIVVLAWHEFILHTKQYSYFCYKSFGHFLHHCPTASISKDVRVQQKSARNGMRLAWQLSSKSPYTQIEHLSMPLLFAIDELLKIPDGQFYRLNCSNEDQNSHSTKWSKSAAKKRYNKPDNPMFICVSEFETESNTESSDNDCSSCSSDSDSYSSDDSHRYNDCSSSTDVSSCSSCSSCSSD